jgi:predicted MFS family arabinose efflux permease
MSAASAPSIEPTDPLDDCPLSTQSQSWNLGCLVVYWCVTYLCAPVSYIGLTHANLLKSLGNTDTVSNLPVAVYQWLIVVPVVAAWWFPRPKHLKPLGLFAIGMEAVISAVVAMTLWLRVSPEVASAAVIVHAAVFGMSSGVITTVQWELVKRGISTSRRGRALGFIYGIGPLFACLGAILQDALFEGQLLGGRSFGLDFPANYLWMFAAVAPLLLLKCAAIGVFQLPTFVARAAESEDMVSEVAAGLRQFFSNRPVWIAVVLYVVVYSGGNTIFSNVSLHAKDVLPDESETLGIQGFVRFGCKAIAGALLGLLLARSNPRATLLATTAILLAGMGWALFSSGWWFMATFGVLGAGELFGAYFPNYITTASEKSFVRVNLAYMNVLSVLIGFSSVVFGFISDHFGRIASFQVAALVLLSALVMIYALLPADPTVAESGTVDRAVTERHPLQQER